MLKVAVILENAAGDVLRFACQPGDITRRWTPSFSVGLAESHGSLRITPPALLLRESPYMLPRRRYRVLIRLTATSPRLTASRWHSVAIYER